MSTQIERSQATRKIILNTARTGFVRDGYDGLSLEKIAGEAGLTKGALYHHFKGKEALFAAVFSLVCLEVITLARKYTPKTASTRDHLKAAAIAWLKAVEASDASPILLDLGPKALGFARARELEDAITLQPLLSLVSSVIEQEKLDDGVDSLLTARLINATLSEIALLRFASNGRSPNIFMSEHAIAGVIDGVLGGA